MAVWQFDFSLVPRVSADAVQVQRDGQWRIIDTSACWANRSLSQSFIDECGAILPPCEDSWEGSAHFQDDQTTLTVYFDGHSTRSVLVRLDARRPVYPLVESLVELAHRHDCVFFVFETREEIDAEVDLLMDAFSRSRAMRWARDPGDVLRLVEEE